MQNESTQQPNLDQDQHDKWLESQSPEQIKRMAGRLGALFRSKEQNGTLSSPSEQPEPMLKS